MAFSPPWAFWAPEILKKEPPPGPKPLDNIWCVADPDIPAKLQRGLAIARQIASRTYRKWPPV